MEYPPILWNLWILLISFKMFMWYGLAFSIMFLFIFEFSLIRKYWANFYSKNKKLHVFQFCTFNIGTY